MYLYHRLLSKTVFNLPLPASKKSLGLYVKTFGCLLLQSYFDNFTTSEDTQTTGLQHNYICPEDLFGIVLSSDRNRKTLWPALNNMVTGENENIEKQDEKIISDPVKEQRIWKEDNGLFITKFNCLHFYKLQAESLTPQLGCSHGNPLSIYPLERDYSFSPAFS